MAKCIYPNCKCDTTHGMPACGNNPSQRFCAVHTYEDGRGRYIAASVDGVDSCGFIPCDYEFNPMQGAMECNSCGSFFYPK